MSRSTLSAQKRTTTGRKVKKLRRDNLLPGNIFGKKTKSLAVQLHLTDFNRVFNEAGETNLVDLVVDKDKPRPVLITNIQSDPISDQPLHVDFHQVDLSVKVTANIPVEIIGESPAVKEAGGVLVTPLSEIEIEALPTDLPDKFEVDISTLKEVGNTFTVADLKIDKKVEIKLEPDAAIALVQAQKQEEEPEISPETPEEEGEVAEAVGGKETVEAKPDAESTDNKPQGEDKSESGGDDKNKDK